MNANLINALTHAKLCRQALGQANVSLYLDCALDECDRLIKGLEDDIVLEAKAANKRNVNPVKLDVVA